VSAGAGRSLVAVVAHPDDEALIAGGTLALAAAAGTATGVVSLTRGELGPVADASLAAGETLADARERELGDSGAALGARWARCLRLRDGELAWADTSAAGRELADILSPWRPAVLLTFAEDGLYGHPDHVATRLIARAGAGLLSPSPLVLEASWPPALVPSLVAAAAGRGLPVGLWGVDPEAFGSPPAAPAITIDVRPVLERKLVALRAHRSQLAADHLLAALPDDLAARFLGAETWQGGGPGAGDVLRRLTGSVVATGEAVAHDG
jgi:N-acetyl-1-D-myo-inositol-2-amino-2-deoxy-alpha-D-glucopyranoside deacetylase